MSENKISTEKSVPVYGSRNFRTLSSKCRMLITNYLFCKSSYLYTGTILLSIVPI